MTGAVVRGLEGAIVLGMRVAVGKAMAGATVDPSRGRLEAALLLALVLAGMPALMLGVRRSM